jgi:hypothetical protein
MTDYLSKYAPATRRFQEGGGMPADPAMAGGDPNAAPAGAPAGGGDPLQDMLMQVIQTQDPNMALEFCNVLYEQMAGAAGGGAPAGGAPAPAMRKGGTVVTHVPVFSRKDNNLKGWLQK